MKEFTRWSEMQQAYQTGLAESGNAGSLGFHGSDGDVSRFIARYRLAESFEEARFVGYGEDTGVAYSDMLGFFLTWGAFEAYCRVMGMTKPNASVLDHSAIQPVFKTHELKGPLGPKARERLVEFLAKHVSDRRLATELKEATGESEVYAICRAMRHLFVHGTLTVHAGGTTPSTVSRASKGLREFLLEVMSEGCHGVLRGPRV